MKKSKVKIKDHKNVKNIAEFYNGIETKSSVEKLRASLLCAATKVLKSKNKTKKTKPSLGNVDTLFKHLKSNHSRNVKVGNIIEEAFRLLASISSKVKLREDLRKPWTDEKKILDLIVEKDENKHLYLFEIKTNIHLDTKKVLGEIESLYENMKQTTINTGCEPMRTLCVLLCTNDLTDKAPKHKVIKDRISKFALEQHGLEENFIEIKGWDWFFDLIGLNDITPEQYYKCLANFGEMLTGHCKFGEWSPDSYNVDDIISFFK